MNYQRIHDEIIQNALDRNDVEGYYETHHIVPRCLSGSDDKDNLVRLTAREHYLIHWLLYKLHPTHSGLTYAWHSFIASYARVGRFTSHSFKYAREAMARVQAERFKGSGNPFFGKTHTEEARAKVSESRMGIKNVNHKGMWEVDGVQYVTCREASAKVGVPTTTLRHRVKSKAFPNYKFIPK